MLLRRFKAHIGEQNWLAVLVDFVVVVVGIFVGLQVDSWNEQRKERAREQVHLEQLLADTDTNIGIAQRLVDHHDEMVERITDAVTELKAGTLDPDASERFKWTILTLGQLPPVTLSTGGYESLLASGEFALLRDANLKNQLASIAELEKFEREFHAMIVDQFRLPDDMARSAVSAVPHPSGKGLLWQVDYAYLRDHPDTFEILASLRYGHASALDQYRFLLQSLNTLRATILSNLEQSNDPSNGA